LVFDCVVGWNAESFSERRCFVLPGYKKKAMIFLVVSVPFILLGMAGYPEYGGTNPIMRAFGNLCALIAMGLSIAGCYLYAKGKGHHGAWSLLGFLAFIGFIILAFFPDKKGAR
jgi:hypothetical protein